MRVENTVTMHSGKVYSREYVVDYTSPENNDLYVYATGNGQLDYEQRHVYVDGERVEQYTQRSGNGSYERLLYVHEDHRGSTWFYAKENGQGVFTDLEYDVWGMPTSPGKLQNNDRGNYVFATYTGHVYDPVLDIYFAEARFYDATNRQWLASDPAKDGLNWYQYCGSNPITRFDPTGMKWWEDAVNWTKDKFHEAKDWAAEKLDSAGKAFDKFISDAGSYFEKLGCKAENWFNENGELLLNGASYFLIGVGAIAMVAAAAPVAIPMLTAALGASLGTSALVSSILAGIGVYSVAGAGVVVGTTGLWDINEAFTGQNYAKDLIGEDTYNLIQVGFGMYATLGTAYLAPYAAPSQSQGKKSASQDYQDDISDSPEETVTVYRGTKNKTEIEIFEDTGEIMSDSARTAYKETGDLGQAYSVSQQNHNAWLEIWGDENTYIQAHGAFGDELSREFGLDRSMVSVTTDRNVAEYFAGPEGTVFELQVPISQLLPQTLPGAGESEFLIINGTGR